jgi:hypothetical protein
MDTNDTPRPAALRRFRTPIRGYAFATPPPDVGPVDVGTAAVLVREPANPADPLAVAVWVTLDAWGPWRLGYLDRGVAARIAPRLDAGLELDAELEGWTQEPDGRWQRPLLALWPAVAQEAAVEPAPTPRASTRSTRSPEAPGAGSTGPQGGAVAPGAPGAPTSRGERPSASPVVRDARVERRLPGVRRRRVA